MSDEIPTQSLKLGDPSPVMHIDFCFKCKNKGVVANENIKIEASLDNIKEIALQEEHKEK